MTIGRRILLTLALIVLAAIAAMALVPQLIAPLSPVATDVQSSLEAPSPAHWFGTDQSGRDVFARVVHGTGRSIGIGLLATAIALVVGLILGCVSALLPRPIDGILMRIVDIVLAFPEFLIALIVVAILGPGAFHIALAVTIAATPVYIRLARVHARRLRGADHVEAARILGVPAPLAFVRHVVPSVLGSLSVLATIGVGTSILAVAGLSFLGLGPTEPQPEWGLMLSAGRNLLGQAWWVAVFPGLAITLTVLSLSVVGRMLRTRADGRQS